MNEQLIWTNTKEIANIRAIRQRLQWYSKVNNFKEILSTIIQQYYNTRVWTDFGLGLGLGP